MICARVPFIGGKYVDVGLVDDGGYIYAVVPKSVTDILKSVTSDVKSVTGDVISDDPVFAKVSLNILGVIFLVDLCLVAEMSVDKVICNAELSQLSLVLRDR